MEEHIVALDSRNWKETTGDRQAWTRFQEAAKTLLDNADDVFNNFLYKRYIGKISVVDSTRF